jgi:CxxC motif-containing protein
MKQITCINCPMGCRVSAEAKVDVNRSENHVEYRFSGNQCKRGEEFAITELTSPVRSLTTTVRTVFPGIPVLPVRTRGEVPKGKITEIIRELSKVLITEKTGIGEIIIANVSGTGCDIIASSDIMNT